MWKPAVGLVLILSVGCAVPASERILKAAASVETAEHAEAEKYALYELTKAREFLHKAREEYGYADYEIAVRLAEVAIEAGDKALEKAREHPSDVPSALPPSSLQVAPQVK